MSSFPTNIEQLWVPTVTHLPAGKVGWAMTEGRASGYQSVFALSPATLSRNILPASMMEGSNHGNL